MRDGVGLLSDIKSRHSRARRDLPKDHTRCCLRPATINRSPGFRGQICGEIDVSVDLGRIPVRSRDRVLFVDLVKDYLDSLADPGSKKLGANRLLVHQAFITLGLGLLGHMTRKRVGRGLDIVPAVEWPEST